MKAPMKKHAGHKPPAKRSVGAAAAPTPMHDEMKYRAQDALHTLKRAHEIQRDPELMKHVKAHAQTEREALKKIARKSV